MFSLACHSTCIRFVATTKTSSNFSRVNLSFITKSHSFGGYSRFNRVKLNAKGRNFATTTTSSEKNKYWGLFEGRINFLKLYRAGRIAFIGLAIYQAGRQSGLVEYAQNPHKIEKEMVRGVIAAAGAGGYYSALHPETIQVKRVGENIVAAAKEYIKEQISGVESKIATNKNEITRINKVEQNVTTKQKAVFALTETNTKLDEEKEVWQERLERMKGTWHYIVISADSANAFVTGVCPRRVFVHSGLMQAMKPTDDELAIILGHEVSHYILQHVEKEQEYSAMIKVGQLVLFALVEPTGLLSYLYDEAISFFAKYLDASYSRECEEEADELGIELAARACYDTKQGARSFSKLATAVAQQANISPESMNKNSTWLDTHPSWESRIEHVNRLTAKFSADKFNNCSATIKYYRESFLSMFSKPK